MGGQPRYPYPTTVWTPTGGWWCEFPKNCRTNRTKVAVGLAGLISTLYYANKLFERRFPHYPPPAEDNHDKHGHH